MSPISDTTSTCWLTAAEFSGHSLRVGFVTTAVASAAIVWKM
jgi:hypothetical protein